MVPANAKERHYIVEDRLKKLKKYFETFQFNEIELKTKI